MSNEHVFGKAPVCTLCIQSTTQLLWYAKHCYYVELYHFQAKKVLKNIWIIANSSDNI